MNKRIAKWYRPNFVKWALNSWPPFWGAGIRIVSISDDFRQVEVRLKLRWWNKNANRTQYGGSIFSMTDPIYSLMLMGILREQYYVWDRQASINFIRPGEGDLHARFELTSAMLDEIYHATSSGEKYFPTFKIHVKDQQGNLVSEVERTLYVRKKRQFREEASVETSA